MPLTYDPIFAADPNNPGIVAKDAAILIFDPAAPGVAVTITDPTGSPLPNPVTVSAAGFGPAFQHATLERVGWSGAGFTGYLTSYEGMKAETAAARTAAQASATAATTAGANAAAAASGALAGAVAHAEGAQAAAQAAAALVGAPADSAIAAAVNGTGATKAALNATFAPTGGGKPIGKGELALNMKDYGVKGDGVTDDLPAIQALIDSLGSAVLYFPPGDYRLSGPILLHSGIFLVGRRPGFGYLASGTAWSTRFRAIGAPASLVSHTAAAMKSSGVQGIDFAGGGTALRGISWEDATWCVIRDVHMNDFLDPFIYFGGGTANVIDNFLGVNGLRRPIAQRTERVGSLDLGGNDHMISRIQTGGGYTPGATTTDMLNTAYYIRGTSIFGTQLVGEFSETGFYFGSAARGNRFTLSRADKGGGHGFVLEGPDNVFSACHSANMAREADNTYSGFLTKVNARGNNFSSCRVHGTSGYPNKPKYAFEDLATGGVTQDRNSWAGCTGIYGTKMIHTDDHEGGAPVVPPHPKRHAANLTALDVTNSGIAWLGSYTSPTTVASLTGGVNGQTVSLITNNAHVTVAHNGSVATPGSIYTSTGAAKALAANRAYTFTYFQGVWYERAA